MPLGFDSSPDLIVVIPCYNEPNLNAALGALHQCDKPPCNVAILIVLNESENDTDSVIAQNLKSIEELQLVNAKYEQKYIHVSLPSKHAGVGLARKIGMDQAVRSFEKQGKDGIIVCFDADCSCSSNYLNEIWKSYQNPILNLGLVHYEHVLEGPNHEAILNYELYLRYYNNGLRVANYPFAVQTLGSCITVRSSIYQKQGGMNRRKAGEDFYFIHKCMPLGGVGEINGTTIYPSDRVSDRVPFGTGHAINRYLDEVDTAYPVYHPQTFEDLRQINLDLEQLWKTGQLENLPDSISDFYERHTFEQSLQSIRAQAGSFLNLKQRYYAWWDGFRVLKFIHHCRDHYHEKVPLSEALSWMDHQITGLNIIDLNKKEQLLTLRRYDKERVYYTKL